MVLGENGASNNQVRRTMGDGFTVNSERFRPHYSYTACGNEDLYDQCPNVWLKPRQLIAEMQHALIQDAENVRIHVLD